MKKTIFKLFVPLVLSTALLTSCGGSSTETETPTDSSTTEESTDTTDTADTSEDSATTESKEVFVYGIDGDPTNNINPISASGRYDLSSVKAMFSPLLSFNSADDIDYYLATAYEVSDDALTYTFSLRDDVLWHDGETFTADDVVFTYETILTNPTANGYDSFQFNGNPLIVEKVDDYTVSFTLPYAIPNALELLTVEHFIAPKHIWDGETDLTTNAKNAHPIGTGAYMFESYKEGDNLTFVKNENYFLGEPNIDKIIFKIVLDANSALVALQNGEIDALSILPADAEKLDPEQISVYPYTENRIGYLSAIMYRPNMDNEDFRKAIFYAIDKQSIINALYVSEDYARNAHSFLPENATFFSEDGVEFYDFDLAKSQEHLAASGVTNPTVKIGYYANAAYETQATLVQAFLTAAGFNCEIQSYDPTALSKALTDKTADFDLFFSGYIMGIDPSNYATLFVSDGVSNYSGVSNETIDAGFAAGVAELDTAKREEIYKQLQIDFMDYAFFLPIAENKRILAINNRIGGIEEAKLIPIFTFEDMSKLTEVQ
ncbi:MAG: ABC transporter substrate-binding protein [Lachnospirales bacterium]